MVIYYMSTNDEERSVIFEKALANHQAFILDWKFSVEDIVFNIKSLLPNLKISSLNEKQVLGKWTQSMILEDKEYAFESDSSSLILSVISTINQHLKEKNQTFVFFDTKDDNFSFILIRLSDLSLYLAKGFKEV